MVRLQGYPYLNDIGKEAVISVSLMTDLAVQGRNGEVAAK